MKKPVSKNVAVAEAAVASKAARKSAGRKRATPSADQSVAVTPPKNILTAGIKALTNAHEEAVARQSRVFESLLGLGGKREAPAPEAAGGGLGAALDPFGFKKFEDVFDQRVERAMQRLGVPDARTFSDLVAEIERLRDRIDALESSTRKR